jgi:hypothetical protein
MLTFGLLVCDEFHCAAYSIWMEKRVLLTAYSPSPSSSFHCFKSQPTNLCAYISDFQKPLFHGSCYSILDLTSQGGQGGKKMLEERCLRQWSCRHTLDVLERLQKKWCINVLKIGKWHKRQQRQTLNALQYLPCLIISPTRLTTSKTRRQACSVSIASSKLAAVFFDWSRARFFSTRLPPSWATLLSKEEIFSFILSV